MKIRTLIFILSCFCSQAVFGQTKLTPVNVDRALHDTFSFTRKWDYAWGVFKDDNGMFHSADGRKIKAQDSAHLYFTANCLTNIQGGYTIRYCYADKFGDTLRLTFSDGLPAYASVFYIYAIGDSFYFQPKAIYPKYVRGQKFSYDVTKQIMTLNKSDYKSGEIIMGEVDIEFTETFSAPNLDTSTRHYYLKGSIRTPLERTQYGR